MEGQKCDLWTPGSPHLPSRPYRHSTASHRSNFTIACYLTFGCNYSFWHKDSEKKLWKFLCELKCFSSLIVLQEPKNPVAYELLATLQRVWRSEVEFLPFSQCGCRLHLSAKGSRDKGRQGSYKHWEPQSWKNQSVSSKPEAINEIESSLQEPATEKVTGMDTGNRQLV